MREKKVPNEFIVCHGVTDYKNGSWTTIENSPTYEFTLTTGHIIYFGAVNDNRFKSWLVCRDMHKDNIEKLFLEETPEQIRALIRDDNQLITDKEMLDWLDEHAKYHGYKWSYKCSTYFNGCCRKLKLCERNSSKNKKLTIRDVILEAMMIKENKC